MRIQKAEAIFSNYKVIKQRSLYFHFSNLPYCLQVFPYTKSNTFNISLDCDQVSFFIPDKQRKNLLLKILQKTASVTQKMEKEVIKK